MNRSLAASNQERSANRTTDGRPPKRNRLAIACANCRQRKSRCDGLRPQCSACAELSIACEYPHSASLTKLSASKEIIEGLQNRVATLENDLAKLSSRMTAVEHLNHDPSPRANPNHTRNDETNYRTQLAVESQPIAQEVEDPTDGIGSITFTEEEDSAFFGPTSNIALTRQIVRATTGILKRLASNSSPITPNDTMLSSHVIRVSHPTSPMPTFPSSQEPFSIGTEPFILPSVEETTRLIKLYFSATGSLFPYIDQIGFLKMYHQAIATNIWAVRRSWLGLLNMMLAMATSANITYNGPITAQEHGYKSESFYRRGMELCGRQIRHGASLEVVQMLLLAGQYLQGTERSIETWNIHGLAVKAAYQLGLHSPHALQRYPPLEREIRKRTWYGCIMLDRTLSMTMGRPVLIPDNFIKVELPTVLEGSQAADSASVMFFTATITLYNIMSEIFDVLYGNNIGLGTPSDVFGIASQILRIEQKLFSWQHALPKSMPLLLEDNLVSKPDNFTSMRLRVVITLRFLNLRILTHRPLLCKYLEAMGSSQLDAEQCTVLQQVATNSIQTCVQSASLIIKIILWALRCKDDTQQVLGAWWFSLYYAFNASLIIYSCLLIKHQATYHKQYLPLEESTLSTSSLEEAIECLSQLFPGNKMTENCVRYTSTLAHRLSLIHQLDHPSETHTVDMPQDIFARYLAPGNSLDGLFPNYLEFFDSTDLNMGLQFDQFLQPSEADFMGGHGQAM